MPPERRAAMLLPDGRRLAWSEWGPVDGHPVLFCTGAAMSGWLGFGADALAELELRLLAVDRPGLGRSDPHPGKTLVSWTKDIRVLIGDNGLVAPLAVGFSQGAPFAFALAGAGLVQALAIVAGQDQLSHPALQPLLHPDVAGMIAAIRQDAEGFERQVAQTATAAWLWKVIVETSSEHDRGLYRSEAFDSAFRRALQEGFSQGAGGYARDLVNAFGPWPYAPEEIEVPVDLWYGGRDSSPVHSPDFGASLASRLSRATHRFESDEGGSILWTRSREILTTLKARVASV